MISRLSDRLQLSFEMYKGGFEEQLMQQRPELHGKYIAVNLTADNMLEVVAHSPSRRELEELLGDIEFIGIDRLPTQLKDIMPMYIGTSLIQTQRRRFWETLSDMYVTSDEIAELDRSTSQLRVYPEGIDIAPNDELAVQQDHPQVQVSADDFDGMESQVVKDPNEGVDVDPNEL